MLVLLILRKGCLPVEDIATLISSDKNVLRHRNIPQYTLHLDLGPLLGTAVARFLCKASKMCAIGPSQPLFLVQGEKNVHSRATQVPAPLRKARREAIPALTGSTAYALSPLHKARRGSTKLYKALMSPALLCKERRTCTAVEDVSASSAHSPGASQGHHEYKRENARKYRL